jgi:hypothetical protein
MKNNLTIGTIWKDERTGKVMELTAINKETGKLQLSSVEGEQAFTCMSEASLHKHYKLITMTMKEFRLETVVTTQAVDEVIPVHVEAKPEQKKETKKDNEDGDGKHIASRAKIEYDGKTMFAIKFLTDICHLTREETSGKNGNLITWLKYNEKGKELLSKYNAKIV